MTTTVIRMEQRHDSAADWASVDPVLLSGEIGYDETNKELRVGDGVTAWSGLDAIGFIDVGAFVRLMDPPVSSGFDQTQLNTKMDALSTAGGGTLLLNDEYTIDSEMEIPDNVEVLGVSKRAAIHVTQTSGAGITGSKNGVTFNGTIATGSPNLAASTAVFTADMEGCFVKVPNAGYSGLYLIAKIITVTDSTHVVLDRTAVAGVTNQTTCAVAYGNVNIGLKNVRVYGDNVSGEPSGTQGAPNGGGAGHPSVNLITISYAKGLSIEDCELDHGWSMGMQLKGCCNVSVHHNYVHEIGRDGIDIAQNIDPGHHISVTDNEVRNAGDDKIIVGWGSANDQTYGRMTSVVIADNNVSGDQTGSTFDLGRGIVIAGCFVFSVTGNTVTDTSGSGISCREMVGGSPNHNIDPTTGAVWQSADGNITGNTIYRAGQNKAIQDAALLVDSHAQPCHGLYIVSSNDVRAEGNIIRNSYHTDVWVDQSCTRVFAAANDVLDANGDSKDMTELVADVVATSNITLSGGQTIDGHILARGETVFCVAQTDPTENGVWLYPASSPDLTRAQALGSPYTRRFALPKGLGMRRKTMRVLQGTVFAGSTWELANSATPVVVGDDPQSWSVSTVVKQQTVTSAATVTPTGWARENDVFITAQAVNLAIAAPSGAIGGVYPNGAKIAFRIRDAGVSKTITWDAVFQSGSVSLPTATVTGKAITVFTRYDLVAGKFVAMAVDSTGY